MNPYAEPNYGSSFSNKVIRDKFVCKVYSLLGLQLLVTLAIICVCIFVPPVTEYLIDDVLIMILSGISAIIFYMILICITCARMNVPLNYILLTCLTLSYSAMIGSMSAKYDTFIVLAAIAVTVVVVLVITIIATLPCCDVTGMGIYIIIAAVILSVFGLVAVILNLFLNMNVLFLVYSGLACIFFSFYLLYDTQLILGGRRYELSPEEYIAATVQLYVDIIHILSNLLILFGATRR